MYTTKESLTRQLFQNTMISCLKTNFQIEMFLPSRKIQQLQECLTLFLLHFTGLNFKWNIYIKEKIVCNTEQNCCKISNSTFLTTRKTQRKPLVKFSQGKKRHSTFLMTLNVFLPSLDKDPPKSDTDSDFCRNEDTQGETEKASGSSIENQFKLRVQIISGLVSTQAKSQPQCRVQDSKWQVILLSESNGRALRWPKW